MSIPLHSMNTKEAEIPLKVFGLNEPGVSEYNAGNPHRHNYYEIFAFEKGGGHHIIDFKQYPIENRSIHFVSPGQVHNLKRNKNSMARVIVFTREAFSLQMDAAPFLQDIPFFTATEAVPVLKPSAGAWLQLQQMLQLMWDEFHSSAGDSQLAATAYLKLLLIGLKRNYLKVYPRFEKTEKRRQGQFIVSRFKQLLEQHFSHEHSVQFYAEQLSVTPGHLNDSARHNLGSTASALIHERIVLEAKRLLYNSEMSAKEIAFTLHFDDPAYFGRFFRKNTGLSPVQFREEIRKKYH